MRWETLRRYYCYIIYQVRDVEKSGACHDGWVQVVSLLLSLVHHLFKIIFPLSKYFDPIPFQVGLRCMQLVANPLSWQAAETECRCWHIAYL